MLHPLRYAVVAAETVDDHGMLFAVYLIMNGVERFLIEKIA